MAYATKYTSQFYDLSGNSYTVNLKKNLYSGSSTNLNYYQVSPLMLKYFGDRDDKTIVNNSECTFSFYYTSGDTTSELLEIDNWNDWQLELKKGSNLYWLGYVRPDNVNARFIGNYFISLSATDALQNLKYIAFPSGYTNTTSKTNAINVIKTALEQTGLSLDIESQLNTYERHLMASGSSSLGVILNRRRFETQKDGRYFNLNCYQVLEYVLKPFQSKIFQSNGKWVITNQNEINSKRHTYTWSTLSLSSANYDRTLNFNNYTVMSNTDELSKIPPLKKYEVTYRNKRISDTVIFNGTFDSDITGWRNGTGGTNQDFYLFGWHGATQSLNIADPAILGSPNSNHYFFSDYFYVDKAGTTTINVAFNVINATISYTGATNEPFWRVDLQRLTGGATSTGTLHNYTVGSSTVNEGFPIPASDYYRLKIWLRPSTIATGIVAYGFYIDNITGVPIYPASATTATYDKFYLGEVTNNVKVDETDIFFSDGLFTNDVGNFRLNDRVTGLTSSWRNYGELNNLTFPYLYNYNKLKQYGRFKNYLRINLKSTSILFNNLIVLKTKKYNITALTYDIMMCKNELELQEYLESNPTVTHSTTTLSSIDGVS